MGISYHNSTYIELYVSLWFTSPFFQLCFICYEIYRSKCKKQKVKEESSKLGKLLWYFSMGACICFMIACLQGFSTFFMFVFRSFTVNNTVLWCQFTWYFAPQAYIMGFMYVVFLLRIYSSYKDSVYKYNPKYLKYYGIYLISIAAVISALLMGLHTYEYRQTDHKIKTCGGFIPIYVAAIMVLNDISSQVILLYLFINPLIKIIKNVNSNQNTRVSDTIVRYIILTFISFSTSTIMLLLIPILGTTLFQPIDNLTNVICILLCYKNYIKLYNILCCCCVSTCQEPIVKHIIKSDPEAIKLGNVLRKDSKIPVKSRSPNNSTATADTTLTINSSTINSSSNNSSINNSSTNN